MSTSTAALLLCCSSALFHRLDLLDQCPQKWLHICHQPDCLEAAAVAELDHCRWVDVDADDLYPRRQQVADRHGMQHRGDHQAERYVADGRAHLALSIDDVRDDVGQRSVVPDAARQQEIDSMLNAFVHDARFEDALIDGAADRSAAADTVDCPQVMLVSRFGDASVFEVHTEARAEKRLFDVVRGQGVSSEEFVDVSAANEVAKNWPAASMDDCRAADDQRFAAAMAILDEIAGNLAHERAFGLLGGNAARHKSEVAVSGGALDRKDARAAVASD